MSDNYPGFERFSWQGEPIKDILAWARARGEQMVQYEMTVRTPYGPEVITSDMPASFYDHLLWSPNTSYKELARYDP